MASSAAIMAEINAKMAEKKQLTSHFLTVRAVVGETTCLQNSLSSAGVAMKEVGSIGGRPLDGGKTETFATDLSRISANLEGNLKQIQAQIAELDQEISSLWTAYHAAVAAEREAERTRNTKLKRTNKI